MKKYTRLKASILMVAVISVLMILPIMSCKGFFGPDNPPDPKPTTVLVKYVRTEIRFPQGVDEVILAYETGFDLRSADMAKVDEMNFTATINIQTETCYTMWLMDPKRYDGQDPNTSDKVCKDIYVNGQLLRPEVEGPADWVGVVKFKIKNDGTIEQP